MPDPLANSNIALGVTGSIACYKAVDLASKLAQTGALVDVIMTREACQFLAPLTFQSITHRPVVTDVFDPQSELSIDHVAIAERADAVIVAPATANTIAKIANGFRGRRADDDYSRHASAADCRASDGRAHVRQSPPLQRNVETLRERGCVIAGPASGRLASGLVGKGRLLETPELLGCLRQTLGRNGDLAGRKVVVSAGGTQEPIDPVRVIANHSSGKMGYAIAEAARDRGAAVSLVSAPTALPDPYGVKVVRAQTALQMQAALHAECADADALVMAAAVADWRPSSMSEQKVKKGESDAWTELT